MPADPVSAGRKGGQSRSAAKLAAIRRNGFQRREQAAVQPEGAPPVAMQGKPPTCVIIVPRKEGQ